MDIIETVAVNIRAYRKQRGYSQEKLAEIANLHRIYIGSVERGERNLSLRNLQRISKALNVNPEDLLKRKK